MGNGPETEPCSTAIYLFGGVKTITRRRDFSNRRSRIREILGKKSIFATITFLFLTSFFFPFLPALHAGGLTPSEERGKQIYVKGKSPRGNSIEAYIGNEQVKVPATVATCGSCHGSDGLGRPEAGVIPSNIRWSQLAKSYGNTSPTGRKYPPYNEESLKECIADGLDPAGNHLDSSMPIYDMADEDLDDLISYLKKLEFDLDPGIKETSLRIGTILPIRGSAGEIGMAIGEVMRAYFDDINSRGGIYNRKIELVESEYGFGKESAVRVTRKFISDKTVFALVGAFIAGADREIAEMVEKGKIPLVGPFTLFSPDPYTLSDYTFYLFSGLAEQAQAFVEYAWHHLELENPQISILAPADDYHAQIRDAIAAQCKKHGWGVPSYTTTMGGLQDPRSLAINLKKVGTEAIFFYAGDGLMRLAEEAAKIDWEPYIFLPGAMARQEIRDISDIPKTFNRKVYLSYPTLPSDWTPSGMKEFGTLMKRNGFTPDHRAARIFAFVSAKLLVEGLKRSGRDLTREKLRASLEKLYEFQTGLTPPITYGFNRRIGALGAHIVTVDLEKQQFKPTGKWVEPK